MLNGSPSQSPRETSFHVNGRITNGSLDLDCQNGNLGTWPQPNQTKFYAAHKSSLQFDVFKFFWGVSTFKSVTPSPSPTQGKPVVYNTYMETSPCIIVVWCWLPYNISQSLRQIKIFFICRRLLVI